MQIIHVSFPWTLLLCMGGWLVFQLGIPLLCIKISDSKLKNLKLFFRTRAWEKNGEVYKKLAVHRCKRLLPDGGAFIRGGHSKKMLSDYSRENIEKFVKETYRAELAHILSILPFFLFGFIGPPRIILYMLIYALAFNLPCIIAQRYNRPRMLLVLKQMEHKKAGYEQPAASRLW